MLFPQPDSNQSQFGHTLIKPLEKDAYHFWNRVEGVCWRMLLAGRVHAVSRSVGGWETRLCT